MKQLLGALVLSVACASPSATSTETAMHNSTLLTPCPNRPNCVSTQATDDRHRIASIPFSGTAAQAQQRLEQLLTSMPRTMIVRSVPGRLDVEFRSRLFHFVDVAEFVIDETTHVIQFRSGARTGYSDMGVNRTRMEQIGKAFAAYPG